MAEIRVKLGGPRWIPRRLLSFKWGMIVSSTFERPQSTVSDNPASTRADFCCSRHIKVVLSLYPSSNKRNLCSTFLSLLWSLVASSILGSLTQAWAGLDVCTLTCCNVTHPKVPCPDEACLPPRTNYKSCGGRRKKLFKFSLRHLLLTVLCSQQEAPCGTPMVHGRKEMFVIGVHLDVSFFGN